MSSRVSGYARSILLALGLLLSLGTAISYAQHIEPPGSLPPDSMLSGDRRKADSIRKVQQAELAKEAEQHRQDSVKAALAEQEDAMARAREQVRQDSIRAAQKLADEEKLALFMQTPQPWRAIGFGLSGGIGSMQTAIDNPNLFPTSVFAYGFQIATEVTHRLDVELSFSHFTIGGNFPNNNQSDSTYNYGSGNNGQGIPTHSPAWPYIDTDYKPGVTHLVQGETLGTTIIGLDLHYVITRPASAIKFYFGIGYEYMSFTSTQQYLLMESPTVASSNVSSFEQTWHKSGIKLLFGAKHDFELGGGYTFEPFAQIGSTGLFGGQSEDAAFVFQPDQPIITINVDAGVTLYFGWWGTPRE